MPTRPTTIAIRQELPEDQQQIRQVHQLAFGNDAEAGLVEELRAEGHAPISLVAEQGGQVVGHILFSDLHLRLDHNGATIPALALAPLAVLPESQRHGIGSQLIRAGLDAAREGGYAVVVVLGHQEYYPRFGFSPELALGLRCAYSGPYLMALELAPGALEDGQGELEYAPPFAQLG